MVTSEVGSKIKFDETAAISGSLCITGTDSIDFATPGSHYAWVDRGRMDLIGLLQNAFTHDQP